MLARANGIDVFYERSGAGRPFLLLHGNGEDHTIFDGLASVLAERYSVFAPDTRCHGRTTKTATISYGEMADDVAAFITALGLEKPIVLGFSDGGITGLLLAIRCPALPGALIACGANTRPSQISLWFRLRSRLEYWATKDPLLRLMLTEPDIADAELATIAAPTLVLGGQRDLISPAATRSIAAAIPASEVHILAGQTHSSYITHFELLLEAMQPFLDRV